MARLTVGLLLGVVVGVLAGAAAGLHADEDEIAMAASEAGVDPVQLQGAVNSTGLGPREYLMAVGELAPPAPPGPAFGVWDRLAQCESNGRWNVATGNGYFGGLQFDLGSWRAAGGIGLPSQASRATQIAVAQRWQSMVGWRAWPVCSRRLGLK